MKTPSLAVKEETIIQIPRKSMLHYCHIAYGFPLLSNYSYLGLHTKGNVKSCPREVNLSTPRPEVWGLLEVHPEPCFYTSPSKAGLHAVERVNI